MSSTDDRSRRPMGAVGNKLEPLRRAKGWNKSRAARELGLKPSSFTDLLRRDSVHLDTARKLAEVFNTRIEYWSAEGGAK